MNHANNPFSNRRKDKRVYMSIKKLMIPTVKQSIASKTL